jgi:hypothetical protein
MAVYSAIDVRYALSRGQVGTNDVRPSSVARALYHFSSYQDDTFVHNDI